MWYKNLETIESNLAKILCLRQKSMQEFSLETLEIESVKYSILILIKEYN